MAMLPLLASSECFGLRPQNDCPYYLQCVYHKEGGSRIEANAKTLSGNMRTRFFVEPSEEHEGCVHVRCCYNNKYWVPVEAAQEHRVDPTRLVGTRPSRSWVIGTTDEPVSRPLSTLFRPEPVNDKDIRLLHLELKKYVCAPLGSRDKPQLQLQDINRVEMRPFIFNFTGLSRQEALPRYVAFKGDNGKYLSTTITVADVWERIGIDLNGTLRKLLHMKSIEDQLRSEYGHLRLEFHTDDIGEASLFTTFTRDDGTVRIMSNLYGFWKRGSDSDDWVSSAHTQDDKDPDTLFEVVTGDGFVALRNLGNHKFCKRLTADGESNCLSACDDKISSCARLKVEEAAIWSEIYDQKYHLEEARIYNKQILNVATDYSTNDTSKEMKATFSFVKKIEVSSKWETSASSKQGTDAKISFGSGGEKPPMIVGGEVSFSYESSSSHAKGTSETNTEETTVTHEYDIPLKTTVVAKLVGMRACCDVPFSYKKRVKLTTGKEVTSTHHDGIYTVANNYNLGIVFTDNKKEVEKLQAQYF